MDTISIAAAYIIRRTNNQRKIEPYVHTIPGEQTVARRYFRRCCRLLNRFTLEFLCYCCEVKDDEVFLERQLPVILEQA